MTRKDYELIASVLANLADGPDLPGANDEFLKGYREAVEDLAEDIATALAEDNPRFDRDRFLKAAGVRT